MYIRGFLLSSSLPLGCFQSSSFRSIFWSFFSVEVSSDSPTAVPTAVEFSPLFFLLLPEKSPTSLILWKSYFFWAQLKFLLLLSLSGHSSSCYIFWDSYLWLLCDFNMCIVISLVQWSFLWKPRCLTCITKSIWIPNGYIINTHFLIHHGVPASILFSIIFPSFQASRKKQKQGLPWWHIG